MLIIDYVILIVCLVSISVYGFCRSRQKKAEEQNAHSEMVGSGVSIWSATLSVCSGFISSISLLGFPSEIYYQGGMILWFLPMYCIAFPIVAFVFLPVLYNLKLTTIYEYFERRFNYQCRFVTTSLFCVQMLMYNSVALYAPSLAIASITKIPILISILITASLSAFYITMGGAKAGIHTSAIQMALIFVTMSFIITISLNEMSLNDVYAKVVTGRRLILDDFRPNPTIRHSVWSLVIGGTGNILALFAANQLSIQRYMAMDSLKSAQKVVLLNILCNSLILISYVTIGFLIYAHYNDCHPNISNANELLPQFVTDVVSRIPGSVGLFAAAVYSAGISTLSASFTAISSIIINDIWKVYRIHKKQLALKHSDVKNAMRLLPLLLAFISMFLAYICSELKSIILQISFIVFGAGGGPVLGSFCVGLFFPSIRGRAAFIGLIASIIACFGISIGAVLVKVKPISLELGQCFDSNSTMTNYDESMIGEVTSTSMSYGFDRVFAVSYQYYSVIGVISNVAVAMIMQKLLNIFSSSSTSNHIALELVSPLLGYELAKDCTQDA